MAVGLLILLIGSGCGWEMGQESGRAFAHIITGKDSAGATIELELRGDDFTTARVIDVVLGTGESEIISDENGSIEFAIDFPAGVAIAYSGTLQPSSTRLGPMIDGTWIQHAQGIFGSDAGTWQAAVQDATTD